MATLNYCTIITPEMLFKNIELIQSTPYFNVYRYLRTEGVIFRLPKGLEAGVACHVFFEHEINLTNTLKIKTLTLKVQVTLVPVSYGLFNGFAKLDGKMYWNDEDEYGLSEEYFKPDYESDKNIKKVVPLPPKSAHGVYDFLKEILFEQITDAELVSKYAVSLGCQVKSIQNIMFIPVPEINRSGNGMTASKELAYHKTLDMFNDISQDRICLLPEKKSA